MTERKIKNRALYIIAAVFILGFFLIISIGIFTDKIGGSTLKEMIGSLSVIVSLIASYFFGSSKGSSDKTDILDKRLNNE